MSVRRSNPSGFKILTDRVAGIGKKVAKTGWFESAKYEDGTPVAYIASIHEYGVSFTHPGGTPYRIGPDGRAIFVAKDSPGAASLPVTKAHTIVIPARPFMRPTIIEQKKNWLAIMTRGYRDVLAGKTTESDLMELLGGVAAGDVAKTISEITDPPLKPGTIRARQKMLSDQKTVGSLDKPLVASGILFDTLTHVVEDASGNDSRQ